MIDLVLATQNPDKVREMQALLANVPVRLIPLSEYTQESIPETGLSFIENAILKARFASKVSGLPALADDSGLIVPALKGAPGLYSARYAGENASYADNRALLLKNLEPFSGQARQATFICVLASVQHETDPRPWIVEGLCPGYITQTPEGSQGFGYDPIFQLSPDTPPLACLSDEAKNKISHRGNALAAWKKDLPHWLSTFSGRVES